MPKPGNPGTGKHWKTSDFNKVIMTDDRIAKSMGQDMSQQARSKGAAVTDYSKTKE